MGRGGYSLALTGAGVPPGDGTAEDGAGGAERGGEDVGAGRAGGDAFPLVRIDRPEDLIGEPHRSQGIFAADPGPGPRARGLDEVLQFQCQGFAAFGLDLVDAEDLAEEMLLDGRRPGQVDFVEVEVAETELFRGADEGPLPGREVEGRVALRAPEAHL